MRILKLAPTCFFADYGCHVRILEEALTLEELGQKVTICTYGSGRDLPGLDICRAWDLPFRKGVRVGSSRTKLYRDVLLSLKSVGLALRHRPDIIHAHLHEGALVGLTLSRTLRIPLVFDYQGSLTSEMLDHDFIRRDSRLFGYLYRLETIINHQASQIITSTRHAADLLVERFGCSADKVHPLPDAVNLRRFTPRWQADPWMLARLRSDLGIPEGRRIVAYLGLLAEYQGTSHLLRAAAQVVARDPAVHFLLMGFPNVEHYSRLATELGISGWTTFTGQIPYEDAPRYLSLADVSVSPKLSDTEGNGKLLNYMAVGLPTVTFDAAVSHELLGDLGVYARVGDAADLADCIALLLNDPVAADRRGRELRRRAEEHFSWDAMGRRLIEVYDLARRRGSTLAD
ncbi:MAG: glycosyltransferase family 4 protein [Bacteroidetes bacterium]|nr:glycosyltransferase family 4 protein [Bacteroidota bacterium]MCL5025573.1 glycosyltransferase family 4 protein [Chloroflexota bacterium]